MGEPAPSLEQEVDMSETLDSLSYPEALEQILARKVSRKKKRKMEYSLLRQKEEEEAAQKDAHLPAEEISKRQLRRKQVEELRLAKKRVVELKFKRSRIGSTNIRNNRERKKELSKEIKSILTDLKRKHVAEWKLAGYELGDNEMPAENYMDAAMED